MNGKRLLTLLAIVFLIFFVVNSPADAADAVRSVGHGISHAFERFAEFIKKL